jgi:segregation and condensation protein A
MAEVEPFEDGMPGGDIPPEAAFVIDIEGFEGPIDVLLTLAREQKVDLAQISILQLADQYLAFIAHARSLNLELAADYLVMAAWLAYMKSRLLLPELGGKDEPTGAELAAALSFRLRRLEAMREAARALTGRPQLGEAFFCRGMPEQAATVTREVFNASLYDLLAAYAALRNRTRVKSLRIDVPELYAVEDALVRLRRLLGHTLDWQNLLRFLPEGVAQGLLARSALASTFVASLELVKEGRARIRQTATYGPIAIRGAENGEGNDHE